MPTRRLLFGSGILIAILPFLGFPSYWDTVFYVLLGLLISGASFLIKNTQMGTKPQSPQNQSSSFIENSPIQKVLSSHKRKKVRHVHPIKELETQIPDISTDV
ncbi:MAG: hypothetical protein KAR00_01900 [Candidatus Pacebacteria bacterium]|nr:hypothetical protein [Candidatus Paceibacterota bacterium]